MPNIFWVALPLLVYGGYVLVGLIRRRPPKRRAINIHTSVLLMVYVLVTAGLGVFWVANQQLPPFDLHYLFGYGTLVLVAVHLTFNLPLVVRFIRNKKQGTQKSDPAVGAWLGVAFAVAVAFFVGMRHGSTEVHFGETAVDSVAAVVRYHEVSSHTRLGVFARAPAASWGGSPPPFLRVEGAPIKLPAPQSVAHAARSISEAVRGPASARELDLAAISAMLFHAAGVTANRGGFFLRAAPSSGALFPTEVYLIARDVESLSAGVYHYQPRTHRLVRMTDGAPVDRLGVDTTASAWIALTSLFRRTGVKYRDRAYRYAAADAGHLLENLRLGAFEMGVTALPLAHFDDVRLGQLLGIDGVEQGVMSLIALGSRKPEAGRFVAGGFAAARPATKKAEIGVTALVQSATRLRSLPREAVEGTRADIPLPLATAAPGAVFEVIAKRRSTRRFTSSSLSLEELSGLLQDSAHPARSLSDAVRLHLVVNRVRGLARGVYRYHPSVHRLALHAKGDHSAKAMAAALAQKVIGDAAVVFIFTVRHVRMFHRDGARGYRHAFLETGMIGERLLLGAAARGLGACPVGAFYDDEAAKLLGVVDEWVLHFAGVGSLSEGA